MFYGADIKDKELTFLTSRLQRVYSKTLKLVCESHSNNVLPFLQSKIITTKTGFIMMDKGVNHDALARINL